MRPFILASAMMLMCYSVIAQDVQWATAVLDFSSQLSEYQYAASQVLGKPDVLPDFGDNPNAWLPSRPNRISFIKVGYDQPMTIRQIAVGESFNPGSLYQVFLYDENDNEYLLNTFVPRPLNVEGRLLNIYLTETEFTVSAVKIVLDGSKVAGYNGIDAIGISGTTIPIVASKDLAFRRNPGLENLFLSLGAEEDVSDTRPVFSRSLNTLFFTRIGSPRNTGEADDPGDVWKTLYDETTERFSDAVMIGEGVNDIGYNSTQDILLENGRPTLLLGNISGNVEKMSTNVVKVGLVDNSWGNIDALRIKNARIASYDADYTLAENGTLLILSTLRYDTEGARDLYISRLEEDGRWTEPLNMGSIINTTLDEYAPFYSDDEEALYFASNGIPGFGGSDIFRVTRIDDSWENWTTPENIGTDINTEADERYYFFDESDDNAYFARMNVDSTYGLVRVQRPVFLKKTPLVAIRGNVLNKETNRPVNSVISVLILPEESIYGMTISDQTTGSYEIQVPSGNEFRLLSEKEGYESFETSLALENRNVEYDYNLDIGMGLIAFVQDEIVAETEEVPEEPEIRPVPTPVLESTASDAFEITFEFDSYTIAEESYPVIDLLVEFLKNHSDLNIELAGFTDHIGNERYNNTLAIRRAEAVKKYMTEKEINANRISVLGFGERMLLSWTEDEKDLRMNRRVEYNFTR